ncbi:MAG: DUF3465 domain-containing protein [Candidatus Thiodiazotropha sp.]|nr:DUF3465 domain-containing protein [Candidatus Thiodiazotropha sp.]MCM8884814.1 DUF3465 domain-containing protein [Candidatus Thiodiazotropha sp.]MCM8919326.1 DUF3465 domain-containing protein [Candidatus Thiodiazotropha sp.]
MAILKKIVAVLVVLAAAYFGLLQREEHPQVDFPNLPRQAGSDDAITRAFQQRADEVQVHGKGTVFKLLSDDRDGSRHQRFLVRLQSGITLLVAHNIDLAARIDTLESGDKVEFSGLYEWNQKGGVLHWTHHDPQGRHQGGWIKHEGKRYQ